MTARRSLREDLIRELRDRAAPAIDRATRTRAELLAREMDLTGSDRTVTITRRGQGAYRVSAHDPGRSGEDET